MKKQWLFFYIKKLKEVNRVERNAKGLISQYSYDVRNRLTKIEEAGNFTSFEYDNQGNVLAEKSKQGVKVYTYDCFNRTASVTNSDGTYIKNYYDPEGLRSEINENGDISRFIFDRGNVITELDENDNLKSATVRGLGIVAQIDAERNSYYYLNNYHGDVTAITDDSGSIVNSYRYDAFGNTVEANEKIKNRFRYCGEQFDNVSNQYYLRARFYNPVIGRFTQEDVYRGDGLNLYAYVGNNPVNYNDPSGYECDKGNPYKADFYAAPDGTIVKGEDYVTDSSRMLPEGNKDALIAEKQAVADKAAQDYNVKYNPVERAIKKGHPNVKKTSNGGVSFQGTDDVYKINGIEAITSIKATGKRGTDFDAANEAVGLSETLDGYVWHHIDDYNVSENTITMELVKDEPHTDSKPHSGGCAQYDAVHGPSYNPPRKRGKLKNV